MKPDLWVFKFRTWMDSKLAGFERLLFRMRDGGRKS